MAIASRLIRTLVIERASDGAVDEYNQPSRIWATLATVRGLIQPKRAREVAQLNQAGAVVSTHTVFLAPTDVREADRILADDGQRYEIDGVRDAAGLGHHLELDARTVVA
jgi:hypothetical protein